jgi:hypothetical protein
MPTFERYEGGGSRSLEFKHLAVVVRSGPGFYPLPFAPN